MNVEHWKPLIEGYEGRTNLGAWRGLTFLRQQSLS
jgi:hypothetical protein